MKTKNCFAGAFAAFSMLFFCSFCTQEVKESEKAVKIENTLKSVSHFHDSITVEPSELLLSLERVNKAIDSIGYPDAGYQLWLVKSNAPRDFKFLVEGYWPDQAVYDAIHNHEFYKNATKAENELWTRLKSVSYNRFTMVKR